VLLNPPAIFADPAAPIRVALYDDGGSMGKGVPAVREILDHTGGFEITVFKAADLANGVLDKKQVVIFTGGSGSKQGNTIGDAGRETVRKFVEDGGGYLGICAGAYLACSKFTWSLGLLDAQTVSQKWRRGKGDVQIEVTASGHDITALPTGTHAVLYDNGPILKPAGRTDLSPYEALAFFRTEMAENGTPVGVMVNSPAVVDGHFGKGRVLISSPHPEQTPGLEALVGHAVRWLATGVPQ